MQKKHYKMIDDGDYGVPDDENPELPDNFFETAKPIEEILQELKNKPTKPIKHKKAA